jgi:hypothetical protein
VFAIGCSFKGTETPSFPEITFKPIPYDGWLSSSLNEDGLPIVNTRIFTTDSPAIYYTTYIVAPSFLDCWVFWYYDGEILEKDWIEKHDLVEYIGYFTASLTRPEGGFKPGEYMVSSCKTALGEEIIFWVVTE